jgi:DNA-binding CsgD family transcriptional regulator
LIPGAALVELDSPNHLTLADEPAREKLIANVRHFITIAAPLPDPAALAPPLKGGSDDLTPREIEVLRLMTLGRTNQEIADQLVISLNTVTNHVKNILGKTGSSNRTEAANYAHRRGIISQQSRKSTLSRIPTPQVHTIWSWTGLDGPKLADNDPTSWVGVAERIAVFGSMLSTAVLGIAPLLRPTSRPEITGG